MAPKVSGPNTVSVALYGGRDFADGEGDEFVLSK